MISLEKRKTRLAFVTSSEIRERGRYRPIVMEIHPTWAAVRLLGCRKSYQISYEAIFHAAARLLADQLRRDKKLRRASAETKASARASS